ncbi:MAG: alpha/beta fold hydrolase [Spirochaetales bacterium]|nr:MAG: alpha/beta fold hydrolase [Spirochaetales bacterium]
MKTREISHIADDGKSIHVYRWSPDGEPSACILVAHGMAEHAGRYARFAAAATAVGFEVWAPDHRGHGKTAAENEIGWLAEQDGFRRVVEDLRGLADRIRTERPGAKLFLLGHSWGSLLSQGFISLYADRLAGCVLSATTGIVAPAAAIGKVIVAIGGAIKGWRTKAPLADKMSFGEFNKPFEPSRTPFDWLSRDPAEVDAYISDPLCGFVCTWEYFRDILRGLDWINSGPAQAAIPKDLPVLLFTGSDDPLGGSSGGMMALHEKYRSLGIRDLTVRLYEGARHETLNEINRGDVTADLLAWLEGRSG